MLDTRDGRRAFLAATHQHDALYDVVVLIFAGNAEARLLADRHIGNVLHEHRIAATLRNHRRRKIVDGANQTDAAHHCGLRADIHGVAADIDVGVAHGLKQLR